MKKAVCLATVLPVVLTVGLGLCTVPGLAGLAGTGGSAGPPSSLSSIPEPMLQLYEAASGTCPGLSWTVLAAVGAVESDHGRSALPGVHSGANEAGAEGPMQFEPATFAAYSRPIPPGGADPPSPYDPTDAVYAAARMLCADGGGDPARLATALFDYNHSGSYVAEVLARSSSFGLAALATAGAAAVRYALAQVGTPYRWGGETPGVGFDCSGLAQAAWAAAGVVIPRVAQEQFAAGPPVAQGQPLQPGDLVYFGDGSGSVTHVGLVVDPRGEMVDAPHAGATVRVEGFPVRIGERWGSDVYLGATDPAGAA